MAPCTTRISPSAQGEPESFWGTGLPLTGRLGEIAMHMADSSASQLGDAREQQLGGCECPSPAEKIAVCTR